MDIIVASIGGLIGAVVWGGLLYRAYNTNLSPRTLIAVLVAAGLCCRLVFALFTPPYKAPDEHSHVNFVRYIDEHRRLPVQEQLHRLEPGRHNWEYHQPPLYYLLMAPLHHVLNSVLHWSEFRVLQGLRLASVLIWILTVLATLRLLHHLGLVDDFRGMCVLAAICLLPTYVFISSVVNNDGLVVAIGALFFLRLVRAQRGYHFAWMGVLVGLAIWSKQSGVVLGVAATGTLMVRVLRGDTSWGRGILDLSIVTVFALAVWAPVAIRHVQLYGSVTGGSYYYAFLREAWTLKEVVSYVIKTFIAASGEFNEIIFVPPKITVALTMVLAALIASAGVCRRPEMMETLNGNRAFLWGGGLATLANMWIMVQIALISGTGQGRHLFPVLIPMALLTAAGLQSWGLTRRIRFAAVHVAGLALTYAWAFTAYSLTRLGVAP